MSSYNWNEAPEWANYAATDANEESFWFEKRPSYDGTDGVWRAIDGCIKRIGKSSKGLEGFPASTTLENRPHEVSTLKEQVLSLFTTGALIVGKCNVCEGSGCYEDCQDYMSVCSICHGTGISVTNGATK